MDLDLPNVRARDKSITAWGQYIMNLLVVEIDRNTCYISQSEIIVIDRGTPLKQIHLLALLKNKKKLGAELWSIIFTKVMWRMKQYSILVILTLQVNIDKILHSSWMKYAEALPMIPKLYFFHIVVFTAYNNSSVSSLNLHESFLLLKCSGQCCNNFSWTFAIILYLLLSRSARCSDIQTVFVGPLKNSWYNVWFYLHHLWFIYLNTRFLVLSATNFLSKEYMFVTICHGLFLERDFNHVSSETTLMSHISILVHAWKLFLYQTCDIDLLGLRLIPVFYTADCVVSYKSNMESWPKLN